MAIVYPHVTGQAYTEQDRGRAQGDWQLKVMEEILTATETTQTLAFGTVDYQGRPTIYLASAARTAIPTTYPVYSRGASGLVVTISCTAAGVTPSVVFNISGYNPGSDSYPTLLSSSAVTGISVTRLTISPVVATVANASLTMQIPDTVKVTATHGNSVSITYSVSLDWID